MLRQVWSIAAFTLLLVAASCASAEAPAEGRAVRYTAIPDQNTTEMAEKFKPFSDHLSALLEVPFEYVPTRDYQASVEAFKNGDVLLAWFGGLTGVQARAAVAGARAIAQGEEDPQYVSYFVAHRDTGLERSDEFPRELSRLLFTFGSESSTSGRLMPEYYIRKMTGKAPREFFEKPFGFSGSHDKTAELVESGQYQAGVLNYKVYERRVSEGSTDPEVCKVIWKTPAYTDYSWTAHPGLDQLFGAGFIERLQSALVSIDDPALLSALPRNRLIPAQNSDFQGIEEVAKELGMLR